MVLFLLESVPRTETRLNFLLYPIYTNIGAVNRTYAVLDDFGIAEAQRLPYWNNADVIGGQIQFDMEPGTLLPGSSCPGSSAPGVDCPASYSACRC